MQNMYMKIILDQYFVVGEYIQIDIGASAAYYTNNNNEYLTSRLFQTLGLISTSAPETTLFPRTHSPRGYWLYETSGAE